MGNENSKKKGPIKDGKNGEKHLNGKVNGLNVKNKSDHNGATIEKAEKPDGELTTNTENKESIVEIDGFNVEAPVNGSKDIPGISTEAQVISPKNVPTIQKQQTDEAKGDLKDDEEAPSSEQPESGTCKKEATTDIISSHMELVPHYTEIATQTEKIFKEDAFTQTEDNFTETALIIYPQAAAKEDIHFFVKEHLEVVMEEESEFLIIGEPVCKEIANDKRMDSQTNLIVFSEVVIVESNGLQEKEVHGAESMDVSEELEVSEIKTKMVVDQLTNVLEMRNTEPLQGNVTKESIREELETCYKEEDSLPKDAPAKVAPRKLPENTDCAPAVYEADCTLAVYEADCAPAVYEADCTLAVYEADCILAVYEADCTLAVYEADCTPAVYEADCTPAVYEADCTLAVFEADLASTDEMTVKMSAEAIAHRVLIECKTEETETVHIQESETEPNGSGPACATEFSTEEARDGSTLKTEVDHTTLRVVVMDSDDSPGNLPVVQMMENNSDILPAIPEPTVTRVPAAGEIQVPECQQETPIKDSTPLEEVIHKNVDTERLVDGLNPSKGNNLEEEGTSAEMMSVADMDVPSKIWEPFVPDDKDLEFQTRPESFLNEPLTENVTTEEEEIKDEKRMDSQTNQIVFSEVVIVESNGLQEKEVHGAESMDISEELEVSEIKTGMVVDQVTNVLEMKNTEPVQGNATKESILEEPETFYQEGDSHSKHASAEVVPRKLPENTDCTLATYEADCTLAVYEGDCTLAVYEADLASTDDMPVKMSAEAIAHRVLIECKTEETETVHIPESETEPKQTALEFATEFSREEATDGFRLETEVDHSTLRVGLKESNGSLGNLPIIQMMEKKSNILHAIPEPTVTEVPAGEIQVPAGQQQTQIKDSTPLEEVIYENVDTERLVDWLNPSKGNNLEEEETAAEIIIVADMDVPSKIWEPFVPDNKDQEIKTQPEESFLKEPLMARITTEEEGIAIPVKSFPMTEQQEYNPAIYAFNTNNQHLIAEVVPGSAICSLINYFEGMVPAEPSVEANVCCLQVVEKTLSATHVMPLFGDYEHSAIFNGDPLLDNVISPKEESVAKKVLEAAIDAMSIELIIVAESSDEQSSRNEPPNLRLEGLMESSLQDLEKLQLEDTSPDGLLLDCIEERFNLKDTEMTEAADQFPEIPKQCSQDIVNIFVDEPKPE